MRSIALTALFLFAAACGSADDAAPVAEGDSIAAAPDLDSVAPPQTPAASADTAWVMRHDGMGPLRVGMTLDEARTALGGDLAMNPDSPDHSEGADRCDYPRSARLPAGVQVMVVGERVVRVEVDSGTAATAEGARIGDAEARIQQLYPGRVTVEPHKYTDGHYLVVRSAAAGDTTNLLVFETDGRVVKGFRAGQKPQVQWVEGCS
ncbi:MAG TPA: hypothetical protein VE871_14845 [Longimicrobium sp.]|nr:hypothetical protein [Longimicrobium sp.]